MEEVKNKIIHFLLYLKKKNLQIAGIFPSKYFWKPIFGLFLKQNLLPENINAPFFFFCVEKLNENVFLTGFPLKNKSDTMLQTKDLSKEKLKSILKLQ